MLDLLATSPPPTPAPTPAPQPGLSCPAGSSTCSYDSSKDGLPFKTVATASAGGATVSVAVTNPATGAPVVSATMTAAAANFVFPVDPASGVTPKLSLAMPAAAAGSKPSLAGSITMSQFVLGQLSSPEFVAASAPVSSSNSSAEAGAAAAPAGADLAPASLLSENGDQPGCDLFPDYLETDCNLGCCAAHDQCFARYGCTAKSWTRALCESTFLKVASYTSANAFVLFQGAKSVSCLFADNISDNCRNCNNIVASCVSSFCAFSTPIEPFSGEPLSGKCYDKACDSYSPASILPGILGDRCRDARANLGKSCGAGPKCGDRLCQHVSAGETVDNCYTDCSTIQRVEIQNRDPSSCDVKRKTGLNTQPWSSYCENGSCAECENKVCFGPNDICGPDRQCANDDTSDFNFLSQLNCRRCTGTNAQLGAPPPPNC